MEKKGSPRLNIAIIHPDLGIGRMLEKKRPHLYWLPCAAHCLDLILEDIGKLPHIKKTIERAISISGYIYNRTGLLNMMRRFTEQRELLRPAKTRFATTFITLFRINEQRNNLRKMFTSSDWIESKWAIEQKGKNVANIIFMSSFWNTVVFCLKVSGPLVRVLRLVDGEKRPPMGYIYAAMKKVKEVIVKSFNGNEEKYREIMEIIDRRWEVQLHRPLHSVGYFLNPQFYFDTKGLGVDLDSKIFEDVCSCMSRLVKNRDEQDAIISQLDLYMHARDLFGNEFAIRTRKTKPPGGAERLIVDAAVELSSHGHKVHIFTAHHDKNRCFEETLSGTFPVTVYGSFLPRHIFYRLHAVCAYLRCIFVALCVLLMWSSFDVIVADQVSVVIPLLKLKKKTKVVFYCHFPDLLLAQHTTILRRIYRKPIDFVEETTTGMADLILVNSKFTASTFANTFKRLDARGIRPAVLYPAVNVDQFEKPNAFKLNFLSINRFEKKKKIDLAISAFSMLRTLEGDALGGQNFSDASLTISGGYDKRLRENVEYLEELENLADREGVSDQVKFITSCSTTERNELLSQCLCVLYTPKDEHFGIVPLEAMAAHKPVIGCNSGGPVETIKDGVTGFLCNPTPSDFSFAMARLIREPQIAVSMGEDARKHVSESFSTRILGQRLNRYVIDVTERKRE